MGIWARSDPDPAKKQKQATPALCDDGNVLAKKPWNIHF